MRRRRERLAKLYSEEMAQWRHEVATSGKSAADRKAEVEAMIPKLEEEKGKAQAQRDELFATLDPAMVSIHHVPLSIVLPGMLNLLSADETAWEPTLRGACERAFKEVATVKAPIPPEKSRMISESSSAALPAWPSAHCCVAATSPPARMCSAG